MKRRLLGLFTTILLVLAMCLPAYAEVTTDYEYPEDEAFDFCVHNIWADAILEPPVNTIENIGMVIDVENFVGDPIQVKLYVREQVTWNTWSTEAQTIDKDGTYVFYLDFGENKFPTDQLATIYVKDVKCCVNTGEQPEDPDGEGLKASGVSAHVKLNGDVAFNKGPMSEPTDIPEGTVEETKATDDTTTQAATTAKAESKSDDGKDSGFFPMPGIPVIVCVVLVVAVIAVVCVKKKK